MSMAITTVTTGVPGYPTSYGTGSYEISFKKIILTFSENSIGLYMGVPVSEFRAHRFLYISIQSGALGQVWHGSLVFASFYTVLIQRHLENILCSGGSSLGGELQILRPGSFLPYLSSLGLEQLTSIRSTRLTHLGTHC